MDSIGSVYTPLVHKSPYLIAYFMCFLIVVSVSLMNLVTAVIVDGALEQSRQDKEVQKAYEKQTIKKMIPVIKHLFKELDKEGNELLTLDELINAGDEVQEEMQKIMQKDEVADIFDLSDTDGSGEISIDEFCDGLTRMHTSDQPVEFIRLRKQIQ